MLSYHAVGGSSGLGDTFRWSGSVPAVMYEDARLYKSDYVYPVASPYSGQPVDTPASEWTGVIKKGTLVTLVETHGIMTKLSLGSWVLGSSVRTLPKPKPSGSGTPSSGTPSSGTPSSGTPSGSQTPSPGTAPTGKTPTTTPKTPAPKPSAAASGYTALLKPQNLAIGAGVLVLLALLLRR
jgi:hypothetical protein